MEEEDEGEREKGGEGEMEEREGGRGGGETQMKGGRGGEECGFTDSSQVKSVHWWTIRFENGFLFFVFFFGGDNSV